MIEPGSLMFWDDDGMSFYEDHTPFVLPAMILRFCRKNAPGVEPFRY